MTGNRDMPTKSGGAGGWVHFGVTVVLLAGSAIAFEYKSRVEQWARQKESVPWPENVMVDPETFRLEGFPDKLGDRFVLVGDGELDPDKDGVPDGEITLLKDVMETLKIGTSWDKERLSTRSSNWHLVRIYRDMTKPDGHPLQYWSVQIYYYTGDLNTVPHVPERCVVAGGARHVGSDDIEMTIPTTPSPWDESLKVKRATFEITDKVFGGTQRFVQYYLFSLNGDPESSWEKVRLTLASPWVRYCYFAKMQFFPRYHTLNVGRSDKGAEEFMNYFLPAILRTIPMPSDIEALKASRSS